VFEKLIAEKAYIDPYAGSVWANFTGQPVMGTIKGNFFMDPQNGQPVPPNTPFTANPDGTFEIGSYGPEIDLGPDAGFYPNIER